MRCRACDKLLENYELGDHPHVPDMVEDLCLTCRNIANDVSEEFNEEDTEKTVAALVKDFFEE